jgi:hypothetical protein
VPPPRSTLREIYPIRDPIPSLRGDHPDIATKNFDKMRFRSVFYLPDDKHLIPRTLKIALSRLADGERQIVAAYTRYGNVEIATPEVWKATPFRAPIISSEVLSSGFHVRRDEVEVAETITETQPTHSRGFRPSRLALLNRGALPANTVRNRGHAYQGDMSSTAYQLQAADLPNEENCSLWLKNIGLRVTEKDIFDQIHTGAVSILHIYDATDDHDTKAAKLVFMEPEAAAAFRELCTGTPEGIRIRGKRLHAYYNRDCYRRHTQPSQSRVLHVNGPKEIMSFERWNQYFSVYSVINWDGANIVFEDDTRRIIAFRFSRIDGQAQTCLQALMADESLQRQVWAYYGRDPCAP